VICTELVAIDDDEVDAILSVLEDTPTGLEELRGKLLPERRP
jgi:hypothetical protein